MSHHNKQHHDNKNLLATPITTPLQGGRPERSGLLFLKLLQQHNLTNIMHTRHTRRGFTITNASTNTHTTDVFFSFRPQGDRRLQRTLMRHLAQIPYDDGGMNGFGMMLQQIPPASEHNIHGQLVQRDL